MSKDNSGSWGKNDDSSHWGKVSSNDRQSDYYVGKQGSGEHCHMWREHDSGRSGVEHRGHCKVCDDSSSGGK